MSAFIDWLSQFGSAAADTAGAVGGSVATYIGKRFIQAERNAKHAVKLAEGAASLSGDAKRIAEELRVVVGSFKDKLDTLQQGVKLELANFRNEILQDRPQYRPGSRPDILPTDYTEFDRRMRELQARLDELKSDIVRERGSRHALQQQIVEDARDHEKQLAELQRSISRIEGGFEFVKEQYLRR